MTPRERYYLTRWAGRSRSKVALYIRRYSTPEYLPMVSRWGAVYLIHPFDNFYQTYRRVSAKRWIRFQARHEWKEFDPNEITEHHTAAMIEAWFNHGRDN